MEPSISICIPAYRQPEFLARSLQSIINQNYRKVEVVISDDSPGNEVQAVAEAYAAQLNIKYVHNQPALGTPANWNAALNKATGDLLLLLHHDDWLTTPRSLELFAAPFSNSDVDVVFGRSMWVDEISRDKKYDGDKFQQYYANPPLLVTGNGIGPPSNVMVRRTLTQRYDTRYIWLVDIEYYVRLLLAGSKFYYVDEQLISVGVHDDQATNYCLTHPEVVVKEHVWYAEQHEVAIGKTLALYDYYWRLLRNNKISSLQDLVTTGLSANEIPSIITKMIKHQRLLSSSLLRVGVVSKAAMLLSYLAK